MTAEGVRIRSYLQAQAAKRSPAKLVEDVREATGKLEQAARAVPSARFGERPMPEEWSAQEVMAHVVDAGRHFGDQVLAILDPRASTPTRREVQPSSPESHPADRWIAMLRHDRDTLYESALRADATARLDVMMEHRMFGPLNWREVLLFTRLHDLDHAGQLQKIVDAFGAPRPA